MFWKTLPYLAAAVFLGTTVVAAIAAKHFYFAGKIASTEPVAIGAYRKANEALQTSPRQKPRVVLIGDSRIRHMSLPELEKSYEIVNRGIAGETSAQLVYRFPQDAVQLKPDLIIIQAGINDLVAGIDSKKPAAIRQRVVENLKSLATTAAAAGSKVIILTIIQPAKPDLLRRLVWSDEIRREVFQANQSLLSWPAPAGVSVLDAATAFGDSNTLPANFSVDTLHLNQAAYQQLEKQLAPAIAAALSR